MNFKIPALCICFLISLASYAQSDNSAITKKDEKILAKFKSKGAIYPLITESKLSGAIPVAGVTSTSDSAMRYKLVFSLTTPTNDVKLKAQEINRGLSEIGRIINLHVASGISPKKLDVVIVTHSRALFSLLKNEAFNKEYKSDNPNIALINEMTKAGATFIACGQALEFLEISQESLLPSVKISIAAKVSLSTYQLKGYVLYEIGED